MPLAPRSHPTTSYRHPSYIHDTSLSTLLHVTAHYRVLHSERSGKRICGTLSVHKRESVFHREHARIRTWNLLIRSQTRYPLRHAPTLDTRAPHISFPPAPCLTLHLATHFHPPSSLSIVISASSPQSPLHHIRTHAGHNQLYRHVNTHWSDR